MTSRLPLLALVLALPFAACESTPDEPVVDDTVVVDPVDPIDPMPDDTMAAPATDVTAAGTVEAVQAAGGLTSLPGEAAISNIDGWISQLDGNPDFAPVVEDLRLLRGQLQESPLDGAAIGATLQRLGEATSAAAGGDTSLQTLGSALTEGGNALTGGSM